VTGISSVGADPETDFQNDLKVSHLTISNVTAGFCYFEPLDILYSLAALGDSRSDRVVDAGRGRPDDFDFLVHMV